MFIDVTRVGGERSLRLAVAAIAYMDATPQGCALHLVGGQSLHVEQSPVELEERCLALTPAAPAAPVSEEPAPVLLLEHQPAAEGQPDGSADAGDVDMDPEKEEAAANALEAAGVIDGVAAMQMRTDAKRSRRRRR